LFSVELLRGLALTSLLGLLVVTLFLRVLILFGFQLVELLTEIGVGLGFASFAVATEEFLELFSLLSLFSLKIGVNNRVVRLFLDDILRSSGLFTDVLFLVLGMVSDIISNNLSVKTLFGLFTPVALSATFTLDLALRTTSARDMVIELSLATSYKRAN
jgi:hypothetical protein